MMMDHYPTTPPKRLCHVVILDTSHLMKALKSPVVEGINNLIARLKLLEQGHAMHQEHSLSLYMYGGRSIRAAIDRKPVSDANALTVGDYTPRGMASFYDAVGLSLCHAMVHAAELHGTAVFVYVVAAGDDHTSTTYHPRRLKRFVDDLHQKGWRLMLLTSSRDLLDAGEAMGFDCTSLFSPNPDDIRVLFRHLLEVSGR